MTPFDQAEGPIMGVAGVRKVTNPAQFEDYKRLLKATRALITVAELYLLAEVDTLMEVEAGAKLGLMMESIQTHPEKAANLLESLVTLVVHMKLGGTYEAWFEGVDDE